MYKNRVEAGLTLAKELVHYNKEDCLLLAMPNSGVEIGYIIAIILDFAFDIFLMKKIAHPENKKFTIGAVSLTDHVFIEDHTVEHGYIETEKVKHRDKLRLLHRFFKGRRPALKATGKTVIMVDDGAVTGSTLLGAVGLIKKQKPKNIIVALPVASSTAIDRLSKEIGKIICPIVHFDFEFVSSYYKDFMQVTDEEVRFYLSKFHES